MKKYILPLFLFVFGCSGCKTNNNNTPDPNFSGGAVPFVSANKIPIVKGKINGDDAYFIVDSGASISLLDSKQDKKYGFFTAESQDGGGVAGYGGNTTMMDVIGAVVNVGGITFEGPFMSQDISNVVSAIEKSDGIHISGIIGSNIMTKAGIIIDYTHNSLYLEKYVKVVPIDPIGLK